MTLKCLATGSSGNCYSLIDKNQNILLLDAGIPIKDVKIGIDFKISNVVGCLVGHHHKDHSLSAYDLDKMGIKVIAPYLEKPKDGNLKGFIVRYFGLTDKDNRFVHSNADGSECPVFGFYITHDREPLKMLYITDCAFVKYRFSDIDTLLLGINYADEHISENTDENKRKHILSGHMSLETGVKFIQVTDRKKTLKNIIVCHMSESNSDEDVFYKAIKKVTDCNISFARKGVTYQL